MTIVSIKTPQGEGENMGEGKSTAVDFLAGSLPSQAVSASIVLTLPPARIAALVNALEHGLPAEATSPVVHFMSTHAGTGAGTISLETAYTIAQSGRRVLFIDASTGPSPFAPELQGGNVQSFSAFMRGEAAGGAAPFSAISGAPFFFATFSDLGDGERLLLNVYTLRQLMDRLRLLFDFIVIHSDSALSSPLAQSLHRLTDASVIIAEAERTRTPVVKRLKAAIEASGGRVAGVVLNNQKPYIPAKLYAWLFGRE